MPEADKGLKALNDYGLRTLEDQALVIDPATILANDTDENGDKLALDSIARFADGGKVRLRADGMIEFRPTADYNGAAGFRYTISDGRGGTSSAYVAITVLPRNEGPILRNDNVVGLEDGPLFVIPAEVFGNDIEPDGDVLFFKRADVFGLINHRFLSADFQVEASKSDGTALPSWLHFDAQIMRFTGTPPAGMKPIAVDVWITDPANGRVFNTRFTLTEKDISEGVDAKANVLRGYQVRSGFAVDYEFDVRDLDEQTTVTARLADGAALPSWLSFDAATLTLTGTPPDGSAAPIEVRLTFTRPAAGGGDPLTFTDGVTLDPVALPAGIVYDSQIALFDMKNATVSASIAGGQRLPEWLAFDKTTRQVSFSGFEPSVDAQLARLQVVFTPAARTLPDGTYATTDRGFTLEFIIDPHADLASQIAAANHALAGNAYFAAQGVFALDLKGAGRVTAVRESGAPLPDWLSFDAGGLRFAGSPPPAWVGAVPIRLDIAIGAEKPTMSVITEAVVDDTFRVVPFSASTILSAEKSRLLVPTDFNGTVVLSYDATDEKGGGSRNPAFIFYDVKPMRERPDAASDDIVGREGEAVRFAINDLLLNDFDRDRDALRILELRQPANGSLVIELARVEIAAPASLGRVDGAVWSATRTDGSALPDWLAIDSAIGTLSGYIPLGFAASLGIQFTRTLDGASQSETLSHRFNGNDGAYAVYTPIGSFSGDDAFAYVVTDDREGSSTGSAVVHVAPLYDAPTAVEDIISGVEDTPLLIEPQLLLANDFDVDGNPIRFVDVANAIHGAVSFDGARVLFTPNRNFEGVATFEYVVTDETHGSSTGKVKINVVSTNRAPIAATNVFEAIEDTLFEFTTAQLLANDSDPDGDTISFQSLSRSIDGGRIIELPGGRWQFVPDENVNGSISFSYTIGDGRKTSTGKITFNVAAVNDAPIANADGAGTMNDPEGVFRTKQDQALVVDFSLLVANDRDVEADSFEIVEILDADEGTVAQVGSTAVFTPNAGYIGDAGFHYRVTDSRGASSIGYATLRVMPVVPLPIPVSDFGFEVLEDSFIDIEPAALMANDYAPEGSTLTFVGLEGATRLESGKYRVTPVADFNGELILRYSVQNEQGFPVSTTITISVLPVADSPVARADTLEMSEDSPLTIFASQLLANDSDADKQGFVFTRATGTSGVTVSDLGFGQYLITPDANLNGATWFDYEIEDSTGRTATARVNIAIAPVNDAPVIAAMSVLKGTEDQPFQVTLPNGFVTDADGDALLVELRGKGGAALPSWLAYEHETRTLSGRPPVNFNGAIQLEIAVSDGTAHTIRELLVSIAPVNDAPVVVNELPDVEVDEDRSFSVALPIRAFSDGDGDGLTYAVSLAGGLPLPAWMSIVDGNLVGTPPANFNGDVQLAMTASDGALSTTGNFRFLVRPVNDAPVLVHDLVDYTGQQARPIDVELDKSAFADVDGDAPAFTARLTNGDPLPGWLTFNGERFTGTPPQAYSGTLDIEVTASDGSLVAHGLFRLSIIPSNQAPVLARPLLDVSVEEDQEISFTVPAGAFTDGDGDTLTYSAALADGNTLPAWLTFDGARFTGTPPLNFNGVMVIAVTAGDGSLSATSTFRLIVAPANDMPVLKLPLDDVNSPEDAPLVIPISAAAFTDVDGDPLVYSATLSDGKALPSWLNFDGFRLTGTPPVNYNGAIDIKITASDGSLSAAGVFRLSISAVNDAPAVANLLPDVVLPRRVPVSIPIPVDMFKDADGDSLALSATLSNGNPLPSWLRLSNGRIVGTPPSYFTGALDIQVTASDGTLKTSDAFRLTIKATNVAPALAVPLPDVISSEDGHVSIAIPAGSFTDADGNPLTYTAKLASGALLPSWLNFDGSKFTGTPPANYNGAIDIKVTASDGSLSVDDIFRLTIKPVNDAPVLAKILPDVSVVEDKAVLITIPAGSFTDVDKTTLAYSATLADGSPLPSWLTFNGTRFAGTPPLNFNGTFDIKVIASDGLLSASDVFKLTITPVNDKPVAANDGPFPVTRGETIGGPTAILLANDTDPDGDTLSILRAGAARMGTVKLGANGWIQYTPDFGYEGTDDFTYVVSDGQLTSTATVRLTVSQAFEGWVQGTAKADTLVGGNDVSNWIFGGIGADTISGGDRADRLAGGTGNDKLYGYDGEDEFWGMAGNDTIYGGAGTDTVHFNGVRASYSLVTSGGSIKVTDNQTSVNGNDGVDTLSSIEQLLFRDAERVTLAAPIILDLDGMGVETKTAGQAATMFDIDGDGVADDTSWIGATEGFLFLDRDGNGTVSGIGEMSFIDDVEGAFSDLEGLRAFDSNGDGVLSADDVCFGDFRIWQDHNSDGEAEETEITTLPEAKVLSIDLAATASEARWEFGSTAIVNRGRYLRTDGSSMEYVDAALSHLSKTSETTRLQPDNGLFMAHRAQEEGLAPDGLEAVLKAMCAGIDHNASIGVGDMPTSLGTGCNDLDAGRVIALMRQDMAAFGTVEGESERSSRKMETIGSVQFYA